MYADFDDIIQDLCDTQKIFWKNELYDAGRWEELRVNSVMFPRIWETATDVREYCHNDISMDDAKLISKNWLIHKKNYKHLGALIGYNWTYCLKPTTCSWHPKP